MEKQFKEISIYGEKIRTNNGRVQDIVNLWEKVPSLGFEGDLYAVYSNYESDYTGDFDLLVGTTTANFEESVSLSTGNYHVIDVKERSLEAVADAWKNIWSSSEIQQKRTYITDFERYKTDGSIQIYLSI